MEVFIGVGEGLPPENERESLLLLYCHRMCFARAPVWSRRRSNAAVVLGMCGAWRAGFATNGTLCRSLSGSKRGSQEISQEMRARFSDDDWELQADMMEYTELFLRGVQEIAAQLDRGGLNRLIDVLTKVRENSGRVFFLGVGGSAANASHAVNDFRKIAGIECYAPSDNISELTARINDDGWESSYSNWLRVSRLNVQDAIFVFSVGGGNVEQAVSINIVRSLELARRVGASILGVVGRDGGYTAKVADACVIIPTFSEEMVTPLVEAFQAVVWHMLVSHPKLKMNEARWESTLALA